MLGQVSPRVLSCASHHAHIPFTPPPPLPLPPAPPSPQACVMMDKYPRVIEHHLALVGGVGAEGGLSGRGHTCGVSTSVTPKKLSGEHGMATWRWWVGHRGMLHESELEWGLGTQAGYTAQEELLWAATGKMATGS